MDSTIILAATAGAFLLAGFVKGVIGLGLPTVSIGLLGLLMTPAQAAAILVVPSLVTNIWQAVVGGGLIALARRLWPMLVGNLRRHIRGCGLAAARRYGAGNDLAWRGPCAVFGTRACQCAFQRAAARGNLARPRHGRGDRRDHGGDRYLRHAGHSVHPVPEVRTRQARAGAWSVVHRFNGHARFGARLRRTNTRVARRAHRWLRLLRRLLEWSSGNWCADAFGRKPSGCGSLSGCCCSVPIWRCAGFCDRLTQSTAARRII